MITIYQRVLELGFDSKDPRLLSRAGEIVSETFIKNNLWGRMLCLQEEPTGKIKVWAYPDQYAPEIDKVIISLTKPKRPRLKIKKVNG